ncbi:MAG: HEAT repeat domain-containing protein [Planctomycetota bacterium]|nr:HEAT repeat domain-containing protein [Planctomycetota bacterium]
MTPDRRTQPILWILLALASGCSREGGDATGTPEAADPVAGAWRALPEWTLVSKVEAKVPMKLADGLEAHLFAADPDVANVVALHVDDQGAVRLAETHRYMRSVFDITQQPAWLREELALRSVEDRREFLERAFAEDPSQLTADSEQVRILVDDDGDGFADRQRVLVDGFRDATAGTAAGVLQVGDATWFACIPDLIRIETRGEEVRHEVVHTGFGVHVGVTGHDLHGLTQGPDGRLYFSIGDRGARVTTAASGTIDLPDTGAVFRCELDGTGLEVYATGLRNPQELAFDAAGNLVTADNDTAGKDRARVVHVVEGGDYGWRSTYQHMEGFGPWVLEDVWKGGIDGVLPGAGYAAQGPSGIDYHPGTGFDPAEAGRFVLCDFPKGIVSFGLVPRGASFSVDDVRFLIRDIWAPDAMFGPDGALWVADWVAGWGRPDRGYIHRVFRSGALDDPAVAEVRELLRFGMEGRSDTELLDLLGHADLRVRTRAHLALAARPSAREGLVSALTGTGAATVRLHALWALGLSARRHGGDPEVILQAIADVDRVVRARACRIAGELALASAIGPVKERLLDKEPVVRLEAALALGHLDWRRSVANLVAMLRKDAATDPFLLHAGVTSIASLTKSPEMLELATSPNPTVRRVALLVMRRQRAPELRVFLQDALEDLRVEAARAIYDLDIEDAMLDLADRLGGSDLPEAARTRAIAAASRVGRSGDVRRLADAAIDRELPPAHRRAALQALRSFGDPDEVEPILGSWRPLPPRDAALARGALGAVAGQLARDADVAATFVQAAESLSLVTATGALLTAAEAENLPAAVRAAALRGAARLGAVAELEPLVASFLRSADGTLVAAALAVLGTSTAPVDAAVTADLLRIAESDAEPAVRQAAVRALASPGLPSATRAASLRGLLDGFGALSSDIRLDVVEVAMGMAGSDGALDEALAGAVGGAGGVEALWPLTLDGGDAARGRDIFVNRADVSCQRCHAVAGVGGTLGPALDDIGSRSTPEEILQSLLDPAAKVREGYPPAMPAVVRAALKPAEVRDLVAYLRSLRRD